MVGAHLYEKEQKKNWGTTILIALMILGVLFAGWGTAYEIQINVIQRPHVYTGLCPPPAQILPSGCFLIQVSTDQQGNVHTNYIPSGHINGTGG